MDLRTGANLRHVKLEPCRSIPVVSINHNREEASEEYEARMSWGLNNNYKPGGNKRSCDLCVKGDKYSDNELSNPMKLHHLDLSTTVRKHNVFHALFLAHNNVL